MVHESEGAKDQKLQDAWHLGSDGVKTLAILIFSRTPRQWQRYSVSPVWWIMHSTTSWVIQTKSLLSLFECIDFWALTSIFWGSKAELVCACVCVGEGDKKTTTCRAFSFAAHRLKLAAQMKAEVTSSLCSSYLKIGIYWNLRCDDNFVTTLLVIDRRVGSHRRHRSAQVGLTYITLVGLLSEFFLIMDWHKRRGFSWAADRGGAGTHSHFSQSVASLTQEKLLHATLVVRTAPD